MESPRSRTRRGLEALASVCISSLLVLLLMEGGLRLYGAAHREMTRAIEIIEGDPDGAILCVGDSFTEGVGATRGFSYPHQLAARLRRQGHGARVINAGHSGQNSTELLQSLPGLLADHQPRWVLVLVGSANTWDFYGFREHAEEYRVRGLLRDGLANTRLVRLARLVVARRRFTQLDRRFIAAMEEVLGHAARPGPGPRNPGGGTPSADQHDPHDGFQGAAPRNHRQHAVPIPTERELGPRTPELELLLSRAAEALERGDSDQAERLLYRALDQRPVDTALSMLLARHHLGLQEHELAEAWAERAIMASGATDVEILLEVAALHIAVGRPYKARGVLQRAESLPLRDPDQMERLALSWEAILAYPEAARWLEAAVQHRPGDSELHHRLAMLHRAMGAEQIASSWEARAPGPARVAPASERFERASGASERWLGADLVTIVELVEASGATPVLQTYPNHPISYVARELALERSLLLVDHEAVFTARPDTANLFVPDGHCNDAGYGLMADELARALLSSEEGGAGR